MSRRKFIHNIKRATTQDPCRKSSVMDLFNEFAGMNSRPATSVKKILYQGCLRVNILELSGFYRKVLHELSFFDKIQVCVLQLY